MSKLEELIARLCPDGVEYKELGDICQLGSGGDIPKNRFSDIKTEQYNIPIYSNGIGNRALYGYTDIAKVDKACVTVSARGTIGWCALRNEPFYPIVRLIYIIPKDGLLPGFLKYFLDTVTFQVPKTGIPQLTIPMICKYKLPVPPLEVQREIVHILDSYTASNNELKEQLDKELAARQKQYEWYKRNLIEDTSGSDDLFRLKDVASYVRERVYIDTISKENYVGVENLLQDKKGKTNATTIPSSGNVIGFEKDDILLGNIRPYLKKIWFADIEGGTNGDVLAIRANTRLVLPKYLYYILSTDTFFLYDNSHSKGAKMPRGNKEAIMDYEFSLPPLSEQQRIVDILDRFDALCNDITSGLPAEIEARRKQYEYYRDKLLTFKELKKEA